MTISSQDIDDFFGRYAAALTNFDAGASADLWATPGTIVDDRVLRREDRRDAEGLHEPAFLVLGLVARARHGAGMADGTGELRLPAADDAGDDGLRPVDPVLVVAAGLGVEDGGLVAVVGGEGAGEVGAGVVDVEVLAGGDEGGRPPARGAEVLGDGGGEAARVREDRHRALDQALLRMVAAERAADDQTESGSRQPVRRAPQPDQQPCHDHASKRDETPPRHDPAQHTEADSIVQNPHEIEKG